MSHNKIRENKTCENCGDTVLLRFCPSCGQENIETRQSFSHLLKHFFEDFTHYDSNFWISLKYLLFHPAHLTRVYLNGQRARYVAPVKLYIFTSFVAFLLLHLVPDLNKGHVTFQVEQATQEPLVANPNMRIADENSFIGQLEQKVQAFSGADTENVRHQLSDQFSKAAPKSLFIFMPLFAFVLWIFHDKKKHIYFDHGIFTLHFFSFVLILLTIYNILSSVVPWHWFVDPHIAGNILMLVQVLCTLVYLYVGLKVMYAPAGFIQFVGRFLAVTIVQGILFLILIFALTIYALFNLHV